MTARKLTVPCTLRIEHTFDCLEAHVELDGGLQPGIGDRVYVHGAPVSVPFGERLVLRRVATLTRANFIERALTRLHAMFLLTELYEVSFSDGRV